MKKKIISPSQQKEREKRVSLISLLEVGFEEDDEVITSIIEDIDRIKEKRREEREGKRQKAAAPPYMKDIIWMGDPKQNIPRIGGRGITLRDLAMFIGMEGEITWRIFLEKLRWVNSPMEPWRELMIHVMAWELRKQRIPDPIWVNLIEYQPKRFRTMKEVDEDADRDEHLSILEEEEDEKPRKKRPTKRDLLDAKYAEIMKLLKGE